MKRFIALLCTVMLVVPVFVNAVDTPATETTTETTEKAEVKKVIRLSGDDRYETAVEVSKEIHESFAKVAIVAQGEVYSDALGASSLAGKEEAPILLVKKDSIPEATANELKRLNAEKIIIIGGKNTVNEDVEQELAKFAKVIVRIQGKDRYETAIKIAEEMEDVENIFMVNGRDFPDALSAGAPAARDREPIVFAGQSMPEVTADILEKFAPKRITVVGGENSVSEAVIEEYDNAVRYQGSNRVATSLDVAKKEYSDPRTVILADARDYPDALVGTALAAEYEAPILLVNQTLSAEMRAYLEENVYLEKIYVLGGEASISKPLFTQLEAIMSRKDVNEAPVIEGPKEVTVVQQEYVDLWEGVTITDDRDEKEAITFSQEIGEFDPMVPGRYTIKLFAEDTNGAKTEHAVLYRVLEHKGIELDSPIKVVSAKNEIIAQINKDRAGLGLRRGELSKDYELKTIDAYAQSIADAWASTGSDEMPTVASNTEYRTITGYTGFRQAETMLADLITKPEYLTQVLVEDGIQYNDDTTVVYGIGISKDTDNNYYWVIVASSRLAENQAYLDELNLTYGQVPVRISGTKDVEVTKGDKSGYADPLFDLTVTETQKGTVKVLDKDNVIIETVTKDGRTIALSQFSLNSVGTYTITFKAEGNYGQMSPEFTRTIKVVEGETTEEITE